MSARPTNVAAFTTPRELFGRARFNGLGFDLPSAGDVLQQAKDAATQAAQQAEQQAQSRVGAAIQTAQGMVPDPATLIKKIKVETTHLPPVEVVDPLKPTPPGVGSAISRELKPRFTVEFAPIFGQQVKPVVYAPYGDPGPSDWQDWLTIGAVGTALGVGVTLLGLASFFKGRKGGLLRRYLARRKERKAMGLRGVKLKNLSWSAKLLGTYFGVGALYHGWRWSQTKQLPTLLEFSGWPAVAAGFSPDSTATFGKVTLAASAAIAGADLLAAHYETRHGLDGIHLPKSKLGKLGIGYLAIGGATALAREYKRRQNIAAAQAQDAKVNAAAGKTVQLTTPYKFEPGQFVGGVLAWPVALVGAGMSY